MKQHSYLRGQRLGFIRACMDKTAFVAVFGFVALLAWPQTKLTAPASDGKGPPVAVPSVTKASRAQAVDGTWPMHNVEAFNTTKTTYGPVGGFLADIDGDGLPDYLAIFEEGGVRIDFNPGPADAAKPWPYTMISPSVTDVDGEGLCAGDLDGDGKMDIVIAMGANAGNVGDKRNGQGELEILWGPGGNQARNAAAWKSGVIPSSINAGDFDFVRIYDVNGDGRPGIVAAGGAILPGRGHKSGEYPYGGLQWYEAPEGDQRNLANWKRHQINAAFLGTAYGFERADINGDGFQDFVVIDADSRWGGTKPGEQRIVWYENPGDGTEAQKKPWPMHVIYQPGTDQFDIKPHLGVGDLNGDGLPDVAVQTAESEILVFLNRNKGANWDLVRIPKPYITTWKSRFMTIVDIDGDGRNEIVGALSRKNNKGDLIDTDRAAIFWMKCVGGNDVRSDNWITFPIKRGSGNLERGGGKWSGEKWNRFFCCDLDADGDLDLIGNCEEYSNRSRQTPLSVQWFEAPFANDKQAPSVPQGLKVTKLSGGVRLDWSASTDNVGVAGYKIYRDHAYLGYVNNFNGETLTYVDNTGEQHRYAVATYDAANNTSAPSDEVSLR